MNAKGIRSKDQLAISFQKGGQAGRDLLPQWMEKQKGGIKGGQVRSDGLPELYQFLKWHEIICPRYKWLILNAQAKYNLYQTKRNIPNIPLKKNLL